MGTRKGFTQARVVDRLNVKARTLSFLRRRSQVHSSSDNKFRLQGDFNHFPIVRDRVAVQSNDSLGWFHSYFATADSGNRNGEPTITTVAGAGAGFGASTVAFTTKVVLLTGTPFFQSHPISV